jgi:hypothetical protein
MLVVLLKTVIVLQAVQARNKLSGKKPPLLLKIAPDLTDEDKKDIAAVISKKEVRIFILLATGIRVNCQYIDEDVEILFLCLKMTTLSLYDWFYLIRACFFLTKLRRNERKNL